MSKFIEKTGSDVASVLLSVRHVASPIITGAGRDSVGERVSVRRVPLDMDLMRTIHRFVETELDLNNAFDILNGFSLQRGMEFFFAGKPLDDKDYGLTSPMRALLATARKWLVMFGFVALRNPDLRAARLLQKLTAEAASDTTGGVETAVTPANGTLEQPFDSLRTIRQLIDDVVESPGEAASITRRTIGSTGAAAASPSSSTANTTATKSSAATSKLRVQHFPMHSTLSMPSAMAVPVTQKQVGAAAAALSTTTAATRKRKTPDADASDTYDRTVQEAIIGLRNLAVVNLNDGAFYLEIDTLTLERRVVFMRNDSRSGEAVIDPDVYVHVLDNHLPDDNGRLNTKIEEVIRMKEELERVRRNALRADFVSTHPIQPVEHLPTKNDLNVDHMTDQELYGGDDSSEVAVRRRQEAEEQAVAIYTLGIAAQVLNNKRRDQLAIAIAQRASEHAYDGVRSIQEDRARETALLDKEDFFPLPPGFKVATRQQPVPLIDQTQLIYYYRQALANLAGVPLSLLDSGSSFSGRSTRGGTGGSSGSVSTASAGIGDKRLVLAIEEDRRRLIEFVASLWNIMYRDDDNRTLMSALEASTSYVADKAKNAKLFVELVTERLARATDIAEMEALNQTLVEQREDLDAFESRLRDVQTRLLEISSMPFRFEIDFTARFHIPQEQILAAMQTNAMTELETANTVRMGIGLKPFTEAEFEAIKKKKEQEQLQLQDKEASIAEKHAIKPNVPATAKGGGSAAKKAKPSSGGGK